MSRLRLNTRQIPVAVTALLLLVLFIAGSLQFSGFGSTRVVFNLLTDNAFLGITAIGMTFVILAGGIDLSVGAVVALSTVLCAVLISSHGWHPLPAIALTLSLMLATTLVHSIYWSNIRMRAPLTPLVVTIAALGIARRL